MPPSSSPLSRNSESPPKKGWTCPKCGRVYAPWMPTCGPCNREAKADILRPVRNPGSYR